jgi:hypothetical protein
MRFTDICKTFLDRADISLSHQMDFDEFLRNHAKEIINLVEAAEKAHRNADELREAWRTGAVTSCDGKSGIWSSNNVEVEVSLREALAALNKE